MSKLRVRLRTVSVPPASPAANGASVVRFELQRLVGVAVGVDGVALAGAAPVEAELLDVLQAQVVDQRRDAHLRPRPVDAVEHLADHLDVGGVVDDQQPIFPRHDRHAAQRAEHRTAAAARRRPRE